MVDIELHEDKQIVRVADVAVGIGFQALPLEYAYEPQFAAEKGLDSMTLQRETGYAAQIRYADGSTLLGFTVAGVALFRESLTDLRDDLLQGSLLLPRELLFLVVNGQVQEPQRWLQKLWAYNDWSPAHFAYREKYG